MVKGKHGGAREGAGRKPGYRKPEALRRSESVHCRMTKAERQCAEEIGGGSAAKGLRLALAFCEMCGERTKRGLIDLGKKGLRSNK